MIDPLCWRTWEDRCREEEFPPVPVAAEIPDDVQAFLAWERETRASRTSGALAD